MKRKGKEEGWHWRGLLGEFWPTCFQQRLSDCVCFLGGENRHGESGRERESGSFRAFVLDLCEKRG